MERQPRLRYSDRRRLEETFRVLSRTEIPLEEKVQKYLNTTYSSDSSNDAGNKATVLQTGMNEGQKLLEEVEKSDLPQERKEPLKKSLERKVGYYKGLEI